MLLTFRKRYRWHAIRREYTLSESKDMGSQVERGGAFGNFSNGGSTGFLVNSFDPELNYSYSDFDLRHQINIYVLAELPFGHGKRWGGGVSGAVNQLIGDWWIAGLMRWTSGFPFNVANCRLCWATNWNISGNSMLIDPDHYRRPKRPGTQSTIVRARSPMRRMRSRISGGSYRVRGASGTCCAVMDTSPSTPASANRGLWVSRITGYASGGMCSMQPTR